MLLEGIRLFLDNKSMMDYEDPLLGTAACCCSLPASSMTSWKHLAQSQSEALNKLGYGETTRVPFLPKRVGPSQQISRDHHGIHRMQSNVTPTKTGFRVEQECTLETALMLGAYSN
jgi:hypothetical protein